MDEEEIQTLASLVGLLDSIPDADRAIYDEDAVINLDDYIDKGDTFWGTLEEVMERERGRL